MVFSVGGSEARNSNQQDFLNYYLGTLENEMMLTQIPITAVTLS